MTTTMMSNNMKQQPPAIGANDKVSNSTMCKEQASFNQVVVAACGKLVHLTLQCLMLPCIIDLLL